MNTFVLPKFFLSLAVAGLAVAARADVTVPALFTHHAVLQKAEKVPVWGKATPGESVKVSIANAAATTTADQSGAWRVDLDLSAQGPGPYELAIEGALGSKKHVATDVLIGEVWLAGGQSNMQWDLKNTTGAAEEIAAPANRRLRQFLVGRKFGPEPLDEVLGNWMVAGPNASPYFSAIGYYFGKKLQSELSTPVGLINATYGGSPIQTWMSLESLNSVVGLRERVERNRKAYEEFPARAKAASPVSPGVAPLPANTAAYLYNGMVAPLIPYAFRGVIWYQGENNTWLAEQYRTLFPLMIKDWRSRWNQGDFPFYFCQLANWRPHKPVPGDSDIAELREAQAMALSLPKTGMAVLVDCGEAEDIHFRDKKPAADRLAAVALANTYGKTVPFAGPTYASMEIEGDSLRIRFTHADGGLVAKSLAVEFAPKSSEPDKKVPLVRNVPNSRLEGFALCGEDRVWKWAEAKIDGQTIVVRAEGVAKPVAVRYAWADNPICNLYNGAGFPAAPFRSDDFPVKTANRLFQ